jgi:hypothetical protein
MTPIILRRGMRWSLSVAENYNPANPVLVGVVRPDLVSRAVEHGANRRSSAVPSTDGGVGHRRWKMNITTNDSDIITIIIIIIIDIFTGDIIEILQVVTVNAEPITTVRLNRHPLTNIETVTKKTNKGKALCQLALVDTIHGLVMFWRAISADLVLVWNTKIYEMTKITCGQKSDGEKKLVIKSSRLSFLREEEP